MRPKRVILCVDENEEALSRLAFQLETWGYRVLRASTGAEALDLLGRTLPLEVDLLVAELLLPGMDANELVLRAKALNPEFRALLVSRTVTVPGRALAADAFLPKGMCGGELLRDKIKILVTRKRGPKKAIPQPDAQAVAA